MRRHGLVLLCTLGLAALVAAVAATVARAHSTPQIRAEQAHERQVMAQVNAIGAQLQAATDALSLARQQVVLVDRSLQKNQHRLHIARGNLKVAQKHLMNRLYTLYVDGAPSMIDVLAGSHSLSQIIDRAESAQVLSAQDAELGKQALSFEHAVQARERQLKQLKAKREQAARERAAEKQTRAAELGQQQRLLASIHSSISQLQAQEAARERAARIAAEARLKAELAARKAAQRAKAEALRVAQAKAWQAARPKAKPQHPTSQTHKTPQTRHVPQTHHPHHSPSTPVLTPPPPVSVPVATGAGHPQAASIALHYLGVPYVYGGSSPSGFDCSGLVMYVYAQLGISLPHYTVAQWNATQPISSPAPGDLVFFNGLGHVGIYIGGGRFVDAPHTGSVVRIDSISNFGGYDGARRVP